jgi:hypothetical protein
MPEISRSANAVPDQRRRRYRRRSTEPREQRLTARFTDDELDAIRSAATAAELTLAGFCALAAVAAAHTQRLGAPAESGRDELAEMQRHLFEARVAVNRTGTNLNQAVAAFNATGVAPVWLHHAVDRSAKAVEELDRVVSRIHRRLR